jgi:hypothetical protein
LLTEAKLEEVTGSPERLGAEIVKQLNKNREIPYYDPELTFKPHIFRSPKYVRDRLSRFEK